MTEAYALRLAGAARREYCRVADESQREAIAAREEILRELAISLRHETLCRAAARKRWQSAKSVAMLAHE
jgi:hypothetical protein